MHLQADLKNGVDSDKPAVLDLHSFQNRRIPGSHDKNKCHLEILEGTVYFPKHMLKLMGKTIHTYYNFLLNFFVYLDLSI